LKSLQNKFLILLIIHNPFKLLGKLKLWSKPFLRWKTL
jgi:hypothetical protein